MKPLLLIFLSLLLYSCTEKFDESLFPATQVNTQMAFKRMNRDGRIEPVLEEGQQLLRWQFYAEEEINTGGDGDSRQSVLVLQDGSGIRYLAPLNSTSPQSIRVGTTGLASGVVDKVERNFLEGSVQATLQIESWTPR